MDLKQYKAGNFVQQYKYKSFIPNVINYDWTWDDPQINTLLEDANIKLGELNAFSLYVPDIDIFIRMHIAKEATKSSKIEGTKTELDEAIAEKKDIAPEKRNDWQEVRNYIEAMDYAMEKLEELPLSTRLLRKTHKILMRSVRGETKAPGEYRKSQNWIGGATIKDAIFIPPPFNEISNLMSDLENFLHSQVIHVPHLIKIAIVHYQFETIHPFLDGNGRIGRLLITLYLVSVGLLNKPTLYLSEYLEKYKSIYYDDLTLVRTNNNIIQWIKFFLVAVSETSEKGIKTFQEILKIKQKSEDKILTLGKRANNAKKLLNFLYKQPIITPNEIAEYLDVAPATANSLIKKLTEMNILKPLHDMKRNRIFWFKEYYDLFNN